MLSIPQSGVDWNSNRTYLDHPLQDLPHKVLLTLKILLRREFLLNLLQIPDGEFLALHTLSSRLLVLIDAASQFVHHAIVFIPGDFCALSLLLRRRRRAGVVGHGTIASLTISIRRCAVVRFLLLH